MEKEDLILDEDIQNVIESVAAVDNTDNPNIDKDKVIEHIKSYKGLNTYTVAAIISTATLLLPAGAIMAVRGAAEKAFSIKALAELSKVLEDSKK